jgi:phosphoribosylformylglycinamidine synthase
MMAKLMIVEAVTKLLAAGVSPAEIVLCDNFYTPRVNPEMAWDLKSMVMTCCETALKLGTPFISGKDSSSGTFIGPDGKRLDIPPTLAVLALGRMPDVRNRIPKPWRSANHRLYLAGPLSRYMGGSVYLNTLGQRGDRPADPSLDGLPGFWKSLKSLQESGRIAAASAVSAGGLARRIFEMALGSGFGCVLELSELNRRIEADRAQIGLFAEMTGAMVIEAPAEAGPDLERNLDAVPIGETISDPIITLQTGEMDVDLPVEQLIQIWQKPFREVAL